MIKVENGIIEVSGDIFMILAEISALLHTLMHGSNPVPLDAIQETVRLASLTDKEIADENRQMKKRVIDEIMDLIDRTDEFMTKEGESDGKKTC